MTNLYTNIYVGIVVCHIFSLNYSIVIFNDLFSISKRHELFWFHCFKFQVIHLNSIHVPVDPDVQFCS
jgi:hypothetical protein